MDPADFEEETRSDEPMEEAGPEVELASLVEDAGGEPGGRVLSQVGGSVATILEKAVVGHPH